MSFRGGRGNFRGGRGGGGFGGRGGGGFGGRQSYGYDQPQGELIEMGEFTHSCEGDLVCKVTNGRVPFTNGFIFNSSKAQIGKVDEVLGPLNEIYFSVKTDTGVDAASFKVGDKFFMDSYKMKDKEQFLQKPTASRGRGGRGGSRGSFSSRGGNRGSFGRGGNSRGSFRGSSRGGRGGGFGGRGGGRGGFRGK
ncbi:MAG: putative H/ACA ribonucleoprotein complex subunit 1 [Streblomastix strix]|uniref:H/ACA ribonucleoprotein complex subunit n=1 Tax=Streblomastix strix TaxID=222440 RepID=A0A5J4WGS0_9EUKA|nr:MAG: putative H/ACA ribonucleoprotein complex subunit 1 [Streblomastix strix]